jgi:hypothetical protein
VRGGDGDPAAARRDLQFWNPVAPLAVIVDELEKAGKTAGESV